MRLFEDFLLSILCVENLSFWLDVKGLGAADETKVAEECQRVYDKFFSPRGIMLNLQAAHRARIVDAWEQGQLTPEAFGPARHEIYMLMKKDSYPRFLKSQIFADALSGKMKEKPRKDKVAKPKSSPTAKQTAKAKKSSALYGRLFKKKQEPSTPDAQSPSKGDDDGSVGSDGAKPASVRSLFNKLLRARAASAGTGSPSKTPSHASPAGALPLPAASAADETPLPAPFYSFHVTMPDMQRVACQEVPDCKADDALRTILQQHALSSCHCLVDGCGTMVPGSALLSSRGRELFVVPCLCCEVHFGDDVAHVPFALGVSLREALSEAYARRGVDMSTCYPLVTDPDTSRLMGLDVARPAAMFGGIVCHVQRAMNITATLDASVV